MCFPLPPMPELLLVDLVHGAYSERGVSTSNGLGKVSGGKYCYTSPRGTYLPGYFGVVLKIDASSLVQDCPRGKCFHMYVTNDTLLGENMGGCGKSIPEPCG